MFDYSKAIIKQYDKADLSAKILDALENTDKHHDTLNLNDLALFDQLHPNGHEATRALATIANIRPGICMCLTSEVGLILQLLSVR